MSKFFLKLTTLSIFAILLTACFNPQAEPEPTEPTTEETEESTETTEDPTESVEDPAATEDEATTEEMMKDKVTEDAMMMEMDEEMEKSMMMEEKFDYQGTLEDVTGGNSSGTAMAKYADGSYKLVATFENLPEPKEDYFYEGWVVRKGANMSVISTGALEKVDGEYINTYMSEQDLTDHTFYVLTIEPDDGDPAPADHVVEGTMKAI